MERYLYRGVNDQLFKHLGGKLVPNGSGHSFSRAVYFAEDVYWGDGSVYGASERNAVLMHQRDSKKYPTSGISTTPSFDNAKLYATYKNQSGCIYKIDTERLEAAGVQVYPVTEHAAQPEKPGDQEVILVARDFGALPDEIVVEIIKVSRPNI